VNVCSTLWSQLALKNSKFHAYTLFNQHGDWISTHKCSMANLVLFSARKWRAVYYRTVLHQVEQIYTQWGVIANSTVLMAQQQSRKQMRSRIRNLKKRTKSVSLIAIQPTDICLFWSLFCMGRQEKVPAFANLNLHEGKLSGKQDRFGSAAEVCGFDSILLPARGGGN
jgi:hypothetical protein